MVTRHWLQLPFRLRPSSSRTPQPFRHLSFATPPRNATGSGSTVSNLGAFGSGIASDTPDILSQYVDPTEHRLNVYSTKHNTHMTLSDPVGKCIISVSSGNIGFRKAARGTYDAGFQLGSYLMNRLQQQGLMTKIQRVELVFRGFGQGRDAMTKILLGTEGANFRNKVVRVVDATRLKFGGTRSPKPRRLG